MKAQPVLYIIFAKVNSKYCKYSQPYLIYFESIYSLLEKIVLSTLSGLQSNISNCIIICSSKILQLPNYHDQL